jgi:hypothetical protein
MVSFGGWWSTASVANGQNNLQLHENGTAVIVQSPLTTQSGNSQGASKILYFNGTSDCYLTGYTADPSGQLLQQGTAMGSGTWLTAVKIV